MPLKRSLRANQWSPADASSHKFRVAHRGAAPSSQRRAARLPSLTMANQYFYVRAGVRPQNRTRGLYERQHVDARQHSGQGGAHGRRGAAGEPSRRRRVSGESPAPPRHRADVAQRSTHTHTLTLPSHRNPRMRSNARTSSRPSATRRARYKSCTTSSRRRSRGRGSRSSSRSC